MFFGLWPRGFDFSNHVVRLTHERGVQFSRFGVAYTAPIKEWQDGRAGNFSIEVVLKPEDCDNEGFNFIVAVHGGDDKSQLLVGQWRSWLIVMNGDDYDHSRREKRISARLVSGPPMYQLVAITTGKHGTRIYLDGRLVREVEDLTLSIPSGQKTRLFLGNSPDGRHGWKGDILGLAWYDYVLTDEDVKAHFRMWAQDHDLVFSTKRKPFLLYLFDEKGGRRVADHGQGGHDLQIPGRMVMFERKILSCDLSRPHFNSGFIKDAVVNFCGFIPLGFVFMMTFVRNRGFYKKRYIVAAVAVCFALSLAIEVLQSWIPSRSSDCLDLVLNTLGALLGAMIFVWGYSRARRT